MKLLMITQKMDIDDSILGFSHTWASNLAERVDKLFILALWVGRYHLPSNVEVYSMGKERGARKGGKFLNFHKVASNLVLRGIVDGIFAHQCEIYATLVAPYAKLMRIPLIIFKAHKHISKLMKFAHLLVDRVLTSCEEGFNMETDKKVIMGQAIDTEYFVPLHEIVPHSSRKTILAVGRISPIKRYEPLIEAVNLLINDKQYQDIKVQVVGGIGRESDKNYFQKLKYQIERYRLGDNFDFVGNVPYTDVIQYYQNCDLFVHLCDTTSLDKVVLEAMACEKLVLTSLPSYKPILKDIDDRLILETDSPKELAEKIEILTKFASADAIRIGPELRKIVLKNHSVDGFMNQMVSLYKQLMKK